jgi:hypothetical protein
VLGERLYSLKGRRGQSEWIISDKMPQTLTFFLTKRVVQFGKLWTRIEVTAMHKARNSRGGAIFDVHIALQ